MQVIIISERRCHVGCLCSLWWLLKLISECKQVAQLLLRSIGVQAAGAGELQPMNRAVIIFRTDAKFFGQKPPAKNEKMLCI